MAKHRTKIPSAPSAVSPTKTPRLGADPTSFNDDNPSWRVGSVEMCTPYGWHELDRVKLVEIRQRLSAFETMTWNDILVKGKKSHHSVPVPELSAAARKRLEVLRLDRDELVSLHLSGKERVWGYRIGAVLHLLWWDPQHAVCPSQKKHT